MEPYTDLVYRGDSPKTQCIGVTHVSLIAVFSAVLKPCISNKARTAFLECAYYYMIEIKTAFITMVLPQFRPPNLTSRFSAPHHGAPISMNFFFIENLRGFCRPQVSLLTPIILLYDRRIWP